MLGKTNNQPSKFRTKNWVEMNDDAYGIYASNSQVRFKTAILKASLSDYSDAYILVKINGAGAETAAQNAYLRN